MAAAAEDWVFRWPEMPAPPTPGHPVVIGWRSGGDREHRRQESRAVLRQVIAAWSGKLHEGQAGQALRETPRGPLWESDLAGHSIGISLSYCADESWIGLLRGGRIGMDAMQAADFPELERVARLYLGAAAWRRIEAAQDRAVAFALAWTELEARSKCLNRLIVELGEDDKPELPVTACSLAECMTEQCVTDGTVITVFTQNPAPE